MNLYLLVQAMSLLQSWCLSLMQRQLFVDRSSSGELFRGNVARSLLRKQGKNYVRAHAEFRCWLAITRRGFFLHASHGCLEMREVEIKVLPDNACEAC